MVDSDGRRDPPADSLHICNDLENYPIGKKCILPLVTSTSMGMGSFGHWRFPFSRRMWGGG